MVQLGKSAHLQLDSIDFSAHLVHGDLLPVNLRLSSKVCGRGMDQRTDNLQAKRLLRLTFDLDASALERHDQATLQLVLCSAQLRRRHTSTHGTCQAVELISNYVADGTGKVRLD